MSEVAQKLNEAEAAVRSEIADLIEAAEGFADRAEALAETASRLKATKEDGRNLAIAARQFRDTLRGPVSRPPEQAAGESVDEEQLERVRRAKAGN